MRHRKEGKCGIREDGAKGDKQKEAVDDEGGGGDATAADMDDFLQYFQLQHVKPSTSTEGTGTGFKVSGDIRI